MKIPKLIQALHDEVSKAKVNPKFDNAPCVAILTGPAIIIELVVRLAEEDSGIEMDWGYIGGRACVYSHGDANECRFALSQNIIYGDLSPTIQD